MEKSSSEESAIHRSPSLDSRDSDFARASASGRPFSGRGFTAGAFYGSTGPRAGPSAAAASAANKSDGKRDAAKGSKYVVFYLDLSFVFLLEFKKFRMARGCLCCLKYMMFLFNLIFWTNEETRWLFTLCLTALKWTSLTVASRRRTPQVGTPTRPRLYRCAQVMRWRRGRALRTQAAEIRGNGPCVFGLHTWLGPAAERGRSQTTPPEGSSMRALVKKGTPAGPGQAQNRASESPRPRPA
ncbi:hypothetical protein SKAU_G00271940 [Synaphobranchus kaupii]|uniref:Uncharacterized protein n=1 Tax=Synaphobranchus kaupii TaxID=118154 RepID=A0A9Q1F0N1_SYNKA|nr:hypothetical protein SKAU_G00271940 [Synaphobranchus kaupii]